MPNTDNYVVGNGGSDSDTTRDAESRDALGGSGKVTFLRQSYLDLSMTFNTGGFCRVTMGLEAVSYGVRIPVANTMGQRDSLDATEYSARWIHVRNTLACSPRQSNIELNQNSNLVC